MAGDAPIGEALVRRGEPEPSLKEEAVPQRHRCRELILAVMFATTIVGLTVWAIVVILWLLIAHEIKASFYVLLYFFIVWCCFCSLYILQVGLGSWRWTARYKKLRNVNWHEEWMKAKEKAASEDRRHEVMEWSDVHHFVIVTAYKESLDLLKMLAYTLLSQHSDDGEHSFCSQHVVLVLALEEREGAEARSKAKIMNDEFGSLFREMLTTFQPSKSSAGTPSKASNYKWAVGQVEEYIRSEEAQRAGFRESHSILHVANADSFYDPNFFPNVTYHWCTAKDRYHCVWQPCMMPTCNFWDLPAQIRQMNLNIASQEMMTAVDPIDVQLPCSTYGYSLRTLQAISATGLAADAQDGDVIADDQHLFIKGMYATGGQLRVYPIFLPCLNFSVGDKPKSCFQNLKDRFLQGKRHMLGVAELMFVLSTFSRRSWWCKRRRGWGRVRALSMIIKLFWIHILAYVTFWICLGLFVTTALKVENLLCNWFPVFKTNFPGTCSLQLKHFEASAVVLSFTIVSTFATLGGILVSVAFARMLQHTHFTHMHIGDPEGPFMPRAAREALAAVDMESGRSFRQAEPGCVSYRDVGFEKFPKDGLARRAPPQQVVRRPVAIGVGYPWVGTMLQLCLDCLLQAVPTVLIFAMLPGVVALWEVIRHGHRSKAAVEAVSGHEPELPSQRYSSSDVESIAENVLPEMDAIKGIPPGVIFKEG